MKLRKCRSGKIKHVKDTDLVKMQVRYERNIFRLSMFPKAETYVLPREDIGFRFGKHTFSVGETYNSQARAFVDVLEFRLLVL